MSTPNTYRSQRWHNILRTLVNEGRFLAAVLTDFQGLPFAAAWDVSQPLPSRELVDILAAFTPPLLRIGKQMENYMGEFDLDEVIVRTQQGVRVVTRMLYLEDTPLILTALVPPKRAYRRAMNRAIRALHGGR